MFSALKRNMSQTEIGSLKILVGAAKGLRKVHWIAWDRMCESKRSGGMRFRNYEDFNQTLLAKQAWRMATSPESLCSRVLRACYFEDGDLLSAKCPKGASYTWKSIVHGREMLKEGLNLAAGGWFKSLCLAR
jgi:hypothetical protein